MVDATVRTTQAFVAAGLFVVLRIVYAIVEWWLVARPTSAAHLDRFSFGFWPLLGLLFMGVAAACAWQRFAWSVRSAFGLALALALGGSVLEYGWLARGKPLGDPLIEAQTKLLAVSACAAGAVAIASLGRRSTPASSDSP